MLVLAPISLAEDWSSSLCCEALGFGGTRGFDLIPFGILSLVVLVVALISCVEDWRLSFCCGGTKGLNLLFGFLFSLGLAIASFSLLWSFVLWKCEGF